MEGILSLTRMKNPGHGGTLHPGFNVCRVRMIFVGSSRLKVIAVSATLTGLPTVRRLTFCHGLTKIPILNQADGANETVV